MSLLRWIQGNNQASSSKDPLKGQAAGATTSLAPPLEGANTGPQQALSDGDGPDAKRFGMENPFREALLAAADSSLPAPSLIPSPAPVLPAPSQPPPTQSIASTLHPVKRSVSKSGHRRGLSLGLPSTSLGLVAPPAHDDPLSSGPSSAAGSSASAAHKPSPSPTIETAASNTPVNASSPWTSTINPNPSSLYSALRSLYSYISYNPQGKGTVAPQAFVNKLKQENVLFRSSMHQDAHEFLNFLLNKIVEDMEEENSNRSGAEANLANDRRDADTVSASMSSMATTTSNTNISTAPSAASLSGTSLPQPTPLVQSLFQGTLTNETRCLSCERVTSRSEPFLDLSLDIAHNNISLNQCLRGFSKSEMLTARNKFFCDECCSLVEAEKRMKIKTLPPILLLHLKRFKYQEDVGRYVKLSYRVAFPFELRLYNNTVDPTSPPEGGNADRGRRSTITRHPSGMALDATGATAEAKGAGSGGPGDPELLYTLFAVVVHIGGGPHHGHYVTLVKSRGDIWLLFDDDTVEVMKESDIPKYFGDSTFTMGSVNATAANVGAGLSASAKTLAANPGAGAGSAITGSGAAGASTTASAATAPSGAAATSSAVPATGTTGNSANATSQPSSTGMTTGTTVVPNAGVGTGYVLFYQAANIDLKGLGLVSAAMEAKSAVVAAHANGTPLVAPMSQVVVEQDVPSPFPVLVEEPSSAESSTEDERSTRGTNSVTKPQHSPSSESAFSLSSTSTSPLAPSAPATTLEDMGTPKRAISLEIPLSATVPAAPPPIEEQHSPLTPTSPQAPVAGSSSGTGFFKSLKHSASKPEHRLGTGFGGFGLGMSSPTPRVVHNRGRTSMDPAGDPQGAVSKSATSLPMNGAALENGHVDPVKQDRGLVNRTPSPAFLRVPHEKAKEKEKDKEKENGSGGGGWFSSARKSVSRKARKVGSERSREREKEKEKELAAAYQSVGTTSAGTTKTNSTSERDHPPLTPKMPSVAETQQSPLSSSPSREPPALVGQPLPVKNGASSTNGYGGWVAGSGQMSGGWVGVDGGVNGPGLAAGSVPPGTGSRMDPSPDVERRASDPSSVEGLRPGRREPKSSDMRPASMVESNGMNGRYQRIKPPPSSYPALPEATGLSTALSTSPSPKVDDATATPAMLASLRIPSAPSLSSGPSTTPSAAPTNRFLTPIPRRSVTLNNDESPSSPNLVSPTKEEERQQGLMKRASRKMSLSGGGIRLSGFGFGYSKEKEKEKP
ncbi:hypothetical protein FRB96_001617 [Tulasnella sp. 330]|nr:hypothetical protein FRB96_001617 [Tulasnella sp. 330]